MTATNRWTVYTVVPAQGGFNIVSTLWNPAPVTDTIKVVAVLNGATRTEADRQAVELQQSYDRLRHAMLADA